MFDHSISNLNNAISNLESNNTKKASRDVQKMESFLPVGGYHGLIRISKKYSESVQQFHSDEYVINMDENKLRRELIEIGEIIRSSMEGNKPEFGVSSDINRLMNNMIYTGYIDENAEESDMIENMLDN